MQDRKVTLLIDENGSVQIDVEGVKGSTCIQLTKEVEDALGVVKNRKTKVECQQIRGQSSVQQQQG